MVPQPRGPSHPPRTKPSEPHPTRPHHPNPLTGEPDYLRTPQRGSIAPLDLNLNSTQARCCCVTGHPMGLCVPLCLRRRCRAQKANETHKTARLGDGRVSPWVHRRIYTGARRRVRACNRWFGKRGAMVHLAGLIRRWVGLFFFCSRRQGAASKGFFDVGLKYVLGMLDSVFVWRY